MVAGRRSPMAAPPTYLSIVFCARRCISIGLAAQPDVSSTFALDTSSFRNHPLRMDVNDHHDAARLGIAIPQPPLRAAPDGRIPDTAQDATVTPSPASVRRESHSRRAAAVWWALFAFLCALLTVVGLETALHF